MESKKALRLDEILKLKVLLVLSAILLGAHIPVKVEAIVKGFILEIERLKTGKTNYKHLQSVNFNSKGLIK